ncbi:hypothetical protein EIMP300_53370 [Escherichia coli]|uniref:Inner membrane protein n=1 Tax=Escherichia coli TaxID=562 RepID=A0A8S0FU34_ECOLX|nr:hypothetical protein EIMP300_53370 [Escherichia coli]
MNQSLTLAFLIAAGIGLVVQNTLMVRITQTSSTILIAMLLNSLVGIVLFVSILWFKQGMAGFGELVSSVRWWTLIPGLLGSFFVFASISGYQNVGAATTIAVLVASQLIGGLVLEYLPQPWRTTSGVDRPNLWRNFTCGWRLAGGQTLILIRGWYRLWLTVRGALPYLLYVCDRDEQ